MQFKKAIFHIVNSSIMRKMNSTNEHLESIVVKRPQELFISSNVTLNLDVNGSNYFFRECRCHLIIQEYVMKTINEFFQIVDKNDDSEIIKKSIVEDLKCRTNFNQFLLLPHVYNTYVLDMRNNSFNSTELIGLKSIKNKNWSNLVPFLKYCKGALEDYENNRYLKKGMFHNFNSNRQMATRIVAELLNLQDIIPSIRVANITLLDVGVFHGTLMEKAGDVNPCRIPLNDRQKYNQDFIRQLSSMEFLDAVCYQLDHRLGNYNVWISNEGTITGVIAFDNDAPMTFFPVGFLPSKTYCGCSGVLKRNHIINRPYMDFDLYNHLCNLDYESLYSHLYQYLSRIQIKALYKRIKLLRKATMKSLKNDTLLLVDKEGWASISVQSYLSNNYGMTYLQYFLNVDERAQAIDKLGEDMTNL